jgi:hypothetical protein
VSTSPHPRFAVAREATFCGALLAICVASFACSEPTPTADDANTQPDAFVVVVDAGPLTYETFEDFPRDKCDDNGSLATFNFLGKWENTPDDGSDVFSSFFLIDEGPLRGILDLIPADLVHADEDNLFLHRRFNSTSLAINLCALVDADTLSGYMAKCNGEVCTVSTLSATLVEPVTK